MKKSFIVLAAVLLVVTSASQVFAVSEAAVLSLLISPGARAAGMGEAFVSVADDATASYWNPAGLAFQSGHQISLMHCNWLPSLVSDMFYEFLAYRKDVPSLGGTIGGHITYFNMGEQVRTTAEGPTPVGTFYSWDLAVALSYATKLTPNLGLGVNARYIRSNLAPEGAGEEKGTGVGSSFSADLGLLYHPGFVKGLSLGMNLSNLGPKITYIDADQADPLPTNLKIGVSYKILDSEFNKLRIAVDTNKLLVVRHKDGKSDQFYKALFSSWSDGSLAEQADRLITSLGMEYVYSEMIALRAGYYYDPDGHVKYPTFGAGIKYHSFGLDFAYVAAEQGSPLSDTMRFSLTAGF